MMVRKFECVDWDGSKSHIYKVHVNLMTQQNYNGETFTVQAYEEELDFMNDQDQLNKTILNQLTDTGLEK